MSSSNLSSSQKTYKTGGLNYASGVSERFQSL